MARRGGLRGCCRRRSPLLTACCPPSLPHRLGPAALVCTRFAAAACSPELLRDLDLGTVNGLPAVRSLTAWLGRHSQQLRRLKLSCWSEADAVASCLAAAGAAGQLVELDDGSHIASTEWLGAMSSLRRLTLNAIRGVGEELPISPAISALTALESLHLVGCGVSFQPGARLPACITRIKLENLGALFEEQAGNCSDLLLSRLLSRPAAQLPAACCTCSQRLVMGA